MVYIVSCRWGKENVWQKLNNRLALNNTIIGTTLVHCHQYDCQESLYMPCYLVAEICEIKNRNYSKIGVQYCGRPYITTNTMESENQTTWDNLRWLLRGKMHTKQTIVVRHWMRICSVIPGKTLRKRPWTLVSQSGQDVRKFSLRFWLNTDWKAITLTNDGLKWIHNFNIQISMNPVLHLYGVLLRKTVPHIIDSFR